MNYATVCSGIEAPTVAWEPLGWRPVFFSEIEKFPSAVLDHHYPTVPNYGDMRNFKEWPDATIDVICAGTPCQSFSVAGKRAGMDDPRGNLALTYLAIAGRYRPKWLVWENVPGILSANKGRDFGAFLGALGKLGYGFAYRVLDAKNFGVPQRRRRVFVIGYLGNWRCAAAVLFERHSLQGHSASGKGAGQEVTGTFKSCSNSGGWSNSADHAAAGFMIQDTNVAALTASGVGTCGADDNQGQAGHLISKALNAKGGSGRMDAESESFVTQPYTLAIRGRGGNGSPELEYRNDGTANAVLTPNGGRGGIGVGAIAFDCKSSGRNGFAVGENAPTLRAMNGMKRPNASGQIAIAQTITSSWHKSNGAVGGNNAGMINPVIESIGVRRLTPLETERLQGLPDDYTKIPYRNKPADKCPDGPRYKAIGNSMAVPVIRWIGARIKAVHNIAL